MVYRKEQFKNDQNLSAEHIIRDRRYSVEELKNKLENSGFKVLEIRPVGIGHWDKELSSTDINAKEILAICQKL